MSSRTKVLALTALGVASTWACEPDLDALTSSYQGGMGPTGVGATGGDTAATGGTTETGGSGGAGASSGSGGTLGAEGGMAGDGDAGHGDAGMPPGPASCDNLARDPNESDVDCGGTSLCDRCGNNLRCSASKDCGSGFCKETRCAEPTCGDGYRNQDETAVDCGGSCAPQLGCEDGLACTVNEDCTSQYCKDLFCTDHCTSGRLEANETDEDCGGPDCAPCAANLSCDKASDCESKICFNNVCQAATCDDKILNQDESSKDCGGACTAQGKPCPIGADCNVPSDCESYVCDTGSCAPDIDVPSGDFIDSFEDGDFSLPSLGSRVGIWYPFGDGTGPQDASISPIPGTRGPTSTYALHATGSDHTYWGAGAGVDLDNAGGTQQDKVPYDASAFTGVTFWARAEAQIPVTVVLPDADTDAAGMTCTTCDHHYFKLVQVGTTWQRFTVLFSELELEPGGAPAPSAFAPGGLVSVQFRMSSGVDYDLWIDDLAFVR